MRTQVEGSVTAWETVGEDPRRYLADRLGGVCITNILLDPARPNTAEMKCMLGMLNQRDQEDTAWNKHKELNG